MNPDRGPSAYPSFSEVFAPPEGLYLELLGLHTDRRAERAVRAVRRAVTGCPGPVPEILLMLTDVNWRPHLVAAMAMLCGAAGAATLAALWQAFDSGSWVSPQLAVTAFLTDPDFEVRARQRVEAGCPIQTQKLAGLDWVVRHSAAGPESFADHSGKALTALVALCRRLPSSTVWLEAALESEVVRQTIDNCYDPADWIAPRWLGSIRQLAPLLDSHSLIASRLEAHE